MSGKRLIYFCGSIRGGKQDTLLYRRIIEQLKQYGEVLTEHVGDLEADAEAQSLGRDKFIHDRDMEWLLKSHAVVAEVTQPSLGVGYEIGRAVEHNKQILCLFRAECGKSLSAMIRGAAAENNGIVVKDYKEEDVPMLLKDFFEKPSCQ